MLRLPNPAGPSTRRRRPLGERGAIAIQTAVMLVVLLGLVALGIEMTMVMVRHRQLQTTADAAAMAGAAGLAVSASPTTEARAVSASHGFTHGVDGATVTVNNPPLQGSHAGDAKYVEVIVAKPEALIFTTLFRPGDFDVGGRAVAGLVSAAGADYCMLSLQTTGANGVELMNNVNMSNPTCGVASNSTGVGSIHLHNNATASGPVSTAGTIQRDNGAATSGTPIVENGPTFPDPYKVLNGTPTGGCLSDAAATLSPGRYCNGITVTGTKTLLPGTYWIESKFAMGNGAVLNGTGGVTLIMNGAFAINLANNYTLNITAPTSGTYKAIAMMSSNTTWQDQQFDNGGKLSITGAIYFPYQKLHFFNNLDTTGTTCIQLIALQLQFENNVGFNYNCTGFPINPIGSVTSKLAE